MYVLDCSAGFAFLAGFLTSWTTGAGTKSTTIRAPSIAKLAKSHATQWSLGAAQGASAWTHGTSALVPKDIDALVFVDANLTRHQTAQLALVPPMVGPARAPATEGRIAAMVAADEVVRRQYETQVAIATATGAAPPPAPLLGLSVFFFFFAGVLTSQIVESSSKSSTLE